MSKSRLLLLVFFIFSFPISSFSRDTSEFEFSGDVGFFSNNISRGISQTGDKPALISNLKLAGQDGLYFKVMAAEFDNRANPDTKENFEISYDIGYKTKFEDFAIDVGLIYFHYPGAVNYVNYDFFEGYLDISSKYQNLEFGNVIFVSDNNFNDSGKSLYYNIYAKYPLLEKLSLKLSVGYQEIEKPLPYGSPDTTDWLMGIDYEVLDSILLQVFYTGNTIRADFCNEVCGEKIVGGLVVRF